MINDTFTAALLGGLAIIFLAGCFGIRGELFAEPGDQDPPTLRYDGYYYTTDVDMYPGSLGAVIHSIVLWEDGTAASLPGIGRRMGEYSQFPPQYGTLEQAHEDVQDWIRNLTGAKVDGGTDWGNFSIEGDTIRIRVLVPIAHMSLFHHSGIVESEGIILSDTSFILSTLWMRPGSHQRVRRYWTFHLQSFDEVPSSNNWTHRYWRDPSEH